MVARFSNGFCKVLSHDEQQLHFLTNQESYNSGNTKTSSANTSKRNALPATCFLGLGLAGAAWYLRQRRQLGPDLLAVKAAADQPCGDKNMAHRNQSKEKPKPKVSSPCKKRKKHVDHNPTWYPSWRSQQGWRGLQWFLLWRWRRCLLPRLSATGAARASAGKCLVPMVTSSSTPRRTVWDSSLTSVSLTYTTSLTTASPSLKTFMWMNEPDHVVFVKASGLSLCFKLPLYLYSLIAVTMMALLWYNVNNLT